MSAWLAEVSWTDLGLILQLVIIEGLLSFDNALALAVLVKKRLPDVRDQKHALTWGIWGAYFFRTIVIFIGVWLMKYEWIKLIAGAYLIWIAINELFLSHHDSSGATQGKGLNFAFMRRMPLLWRTILEVEIVDIMFSVDSVGVALAISDKKWVLITGALLGIMAMRVAAQYFIVLVDKFPVLEKTAFILVGIAGLNVLLKLRDLPLGFMNLTIDKPIPEEPFLILLFGIFFGSMLLNHFFPTWFAKK